MNKFKAVSGRSPEREEHILSYGFSVLACLIACILTKGLHFFAGMSLFEFFQAAVVFSAWYGGLWPGLFSAIISFLMIDYFFIVPINHWAFGTHLIRLVIFSVMAVATSWLSGRLKRSKAELEISHRELESRIAIRTDELSVANKRLVDEVASRVEAEKAILEVSNREQRRLGQDLHDGLSQMLIGIKFMMEGLRATLAKKAISESQKMDVIESHLGEALSFVDAVSRGLYPVELDTNGLMAALDELAEKTTKIYSVRCRFVSTAAISIADASVANHLYRIAQEAVVNAIKSGKATKVNIRLRRSEKNGIVLVVADNGVGLGNEPMRKGMGLQMMAYRARIIDGFLNMRSRPRGGTLIACRLKQESKYATA